MWQAVASAMVCLSYLLCFGIMTKLDEILQVAGTAINEAYAHYFTNLAVGEGKVFEAKFIAELISMIQPWLFFTEESLERVTSFIYKDQLSVNLAYTLTALFRQRFALPEEEYMAFLDHVADAFAVQKCDDQQASMMSPEYSSRIPTPEAISVMLKNNRMIAMLASTVLYLNVEIIAGALPGRNK